MKQALFVYEETRDLWTLNASGGNKICLHHGTGRRGLSSLNLGLCLSSHFAQRMYVFQKMPVLEAAALKLKSG